MTSSSSGREDSPPLTPLHSSVTRIPPMMLFPGNSSMYAKEATIKLMKMAQVEFDLEGKYIEEMCNDFEVYDTHYRPNNVGTLGLGVKIRISEEDEEEEYGVFKREVGDGSIPRIYAKEVCIYLHLQELQGIRIPELLAYGAPDTLGYPGFFLITRFYGDPLTPDEVSPREFGELLSEIHARGIVISSPNSVFAGFPTLVRYGSTLMLGDFPLAASFNEDAQRFQLEFDFFVSLCKKDDED